MDLGIKFETLGELLFGNGVRRFLKFHVVYVLVLDVFVVEFGDQVRNFRNEIVWKFLKFHVVYMVYDWIWGSSLKLWESSYLGTLRLSGSKCLLDRID